MDLRGSIRRSNPHVAGKLFPISYGPPTPNTHVCVHCFCVVEPKTNQIAVHGCLLRLERPGEVKSYLVDARFSKRAEAKAAVCLLAMAEGAGDYIRSVAKAIEDKLPASMRKYVSEVLIPVLNAEYRKAHGPGIQPHVEYDMDLDGQSSSHQPCIFR